MDFKEIIEFEFKQIRKRLELIEKECDKEFTKLLTDSIRKSLQFIEEVSKNV